MRCSVVAALALVLVSARAWKLCNVTSFGAKPNTADAQTKALQSAIDACASAGGGEVLLPSLGGGTGVTGWTSGSLFLRSNILFRIQPGAALLGSKSMDNATWPRVYTRVGGTMTFSPASLLNGARCLDLSGFDPSKVGDQCKRWGKLSNVTITGAPSGGGGPARPYAGARAGAGIINGQGEGWWQHKDYRPTLLGLLWVRGLEVFDVFVTRSPFWTIHPAFSTDVRVHGVTVRTTGPNTDGFDPDSCSDVVLERSDLSCGDDVVAIKSGKNEDGRAVGIPTTNVTVRNCVFGSGHGLSIGSEMSGNVTGVLIDNVTMTGTQRGVRVKAGKGRGGVVSDVTYRKMVLDGVGTPVSVSQLYTDPSSPGPAPVFRRIAVSGLTATRLPSGAHAGDFQCLPETPCVDGMDVSAVSIDGGEWDCSNVRLAASGVQPAMPSSCTG